MDSSFQNWVPLPDAYGLGDELSDYVRSESEIQLGDHFVREKKLYCFVLLYFTVDPRRINFIAHFLWTKVKTQRNMYFNKTRI